MAHRWLRGILPTHDPTNSSANNYVDNHREFNVIVHYFLHRVLGWTLIDEVIAGSGSFQNNHSITAGDGVLTSTDYSFASATGGFASGDAGKFICLVDSSSDKNCGIYKIASYVDTNNITLDFQTSAGNYPDVATGVTWYLLDPTNVPTLQDSYYVLESPHATIKTTMKCQQKGYSQVGNPGGVNLGTFIQFAGQAASVAWDAVGHDWKTAAKYNATMVKISSGEYNTTKGRIFGYGNTDGSAWCMWNKFQNGGSGILQTTFFSVLTPFETGRTNVEKVCLHGPWYNSGISDGGMDDEGHDFGTGIAYSEKASDEVLTYLSGLIINGTTAYFRTNVGGPNARTGKRDALPLWVFSDPANQKDQWAPLGAVSENILRAQVFDLGDYATFDSDQYYHVTEGLVVPWAGIPAV